MEKPLEADADAVDVAPGAAGVGEVWICGPTLFSGRGNDVEATAEAITADGWFRTDDLAKVDGDGYLTVLDRATDMIVVCSENVYRVEVERVLDGHPAVELATVYGMSDDALGVKAVVLKQGEPRTAAALRLHAAVRLADVKLPSSVEYVAPTAGRAAT